MTQEEKAALTEQKSKAYEEARGLKAILEVLEKAVHDAKIKYSQAKLTYETIDRELALNDERFHVLTKSSIEKKVSVNLTQDQVNRILAELSTFVE